MANSIFHDSSSTSVRKSLRGSDNCGKSGLITITIDEDSDDTLYYDDDDDDDGDDYGEDNGLQAKIRSTISSNMSVIGKRVSSSSSLQSISSSGATTSENTSSPVPATGPAPQRKARIKFGKGRPGKVDTGQRYKHEVNCSSLEALLKAPPQRKAAKVAFAPKSTTSKMKVDSGEAAKNFESLRKTFALIKQMCEDHKASNRDFEERYKQILKIRLEMFRKHLTEDLESSLRDVQEVYRKELDAAKLKQWCANCLKESTFYCCMDTSYCGLNCRYEHWPSHSAKCKNLEENA